MDVPSRERYVKEDGVGVVNHTTELPHHSEVTEPTSGSKKKGSKTCGSFRGSYTSVPASKIVGGRTATPHDYPWQVSSRRLTATFDCYNNSV